MSKDQISIVVTLTPEARERSAQLLAELKQLGMRNENLLAEIGVVTGTVPRDSLPLLEGMPDISVEADEEVHVPPPDAPVQ